MSKKARLEIGSQITFDYPRHNIHFVVSKLEHRRMEVDEVRVLKESPLDPITLEIQPLLRRGHTLVSGIDLDKHERRSFYLESMREIRACG